MPRGRRSLRLTPEQRKERVRKQNVKSHKKKSKGLWVLCKAVSKKFARCFNCRKRVNEYTKEFRQRRKQGDQQ